MRAVISPRLCRAAKLSNRKQYQLAHAIGVSHGTLSAWLCGISFVQAGDPRVLKLGALLKVPARACFARRSR